MAGKQATTNPLRDALDSRGDGSRAELARQLKVSPSVVWRWVNRDVRPHRLFRKQIAEFVGKPEEELWPR